MLRDKKKQDSGQRNREKIERDGGREIDRAGS